MSKPELVAFLLLFFPLNPLRAFNPAKEASKQNLTRLSHQWPRNFDNSAVPPKAIGLDLFKNGKPTTNPHRINFLFIIHTLDPKPE
jgi:hypothetical protein